MDIHLKRFKGEEIPETYEFKFVDKYGNSKWLENNGILIEWEGRPATLNFLRDVTERKKAEEKLLDYQAKLKSLASQLSVTEERERRRIATELHDQIGQTLVFSKIKLDELHQSATSGELTKALDEIRNNIGQIIQDTRTLTFDLSSPILNEIGFEMAVAEWLDVQIHEKYGIKTEFEDDGQQKPLDDDIRALLFRNVRELLVNVIKHADAHKVTVSIRRVNEQIHIDVEDDGKGFDSVKAISTGIEDTKFGLFSIRQRLEQLGGQFEIDSEPGRGSKITMTAPLKLTKSKK
jgi:signal transduction histidine kinase